MKDKIAITLEHSIVEDLDRLIQKHIFANRSNAIEKAVQEKLERIKGTRLSKECSKLDPVFEKIIAEEGFSEELSKWPEY